MGKLIYYGVRAVHYVFHQVFSAIHLGFKFYTGL